MKTRSEVTVANIKVSWQHCNITCKLLIPPATLPVIGHIPITTNYCKLSQLTIRWVILDVRDFQTPSSEMFKSLNCMPLRDRVTYRKACMMYKSLNGLAPVYM